MMTKTRGLMFVAVLLGLFVAVPDVYAHRPEPGSEDGVTVIPDPTTSYAYYREISTPQEVHVYQFQAEAGQFFHAGINVPQLEGLEAFGITMALLGPGLPPLSEREPHPHVSDDGHDHGAGPHNAVQVPEFLIADLDFDGHGGLVLESEKSKDFFEPFTQSRYWGRQTVELDLPESGTYYLLIWNPKGNTGKYVLDTGTEEVFGPADLFRFPVWWLNIRVYFGQAPQLIGALMLIFSGATGLVVFRRSR